MKTNILFYGNCQSKGLLEILNLPQDNYNTSHIFCHNTKYNKDTFSHIIANSDIIITQPINDNYRDVDYLSTSYILKHKRPDCKVIIFDSCHFLFYYFDTSNFIINDNTLENPIPCHYNNMIKCFKDGHSVEYYIENFVNNIELKTNEELEKLAENSLNGLYNRYTITKEKYDNNDNVYVISVHDYIKQNYKNKLLFYTNNHPTKYVLQNICEKIIGICKISNTINYNADPLHYPKCIIYKCISKNVNFDISNHKSLACNKEEVDQIVQMYYETYKKIGLSH